MNIYDVDRNYTEYLQKKEIEERGFTTVPNFDYEDVGREKKFVSGPVFEIDNIKYYVGASHKKILNDDCYPIYFEKEPGIIKGTLRFQYMIPIAPSAVKFRNIRMEPSKSRRNFLWQYLKSIQKNKPFIMEKSNEVYLKQISNQIPEDLKDRFNQFKFLESKMIQYELNYKLGLLNTEEELPVVYNENLQQHIVLYEGYGRPVEPKHLKDFNLLAHTVDFDLEEMESVEEYLNEIEL